MKLSAALIVKNESDHIERCLDSIRPYVDEIVIVDTGSTDETLDIASRFTDRIFQSKRFHADTEPEAFHFGEARNEALSHCRSEWILSIDADETLVCRGRPSFDQPIAFNLWIRTKRINNSLLPGNDFWNRTPRLMPRTMTRWQGRCHELPCPYSSKPIVRKELMHIVHHASSARKDSAIRNLALLRHQFLDLDQYDGWWPDRLSWRIRTLSNLADTYRDLEYWPEALGCREMLSNITRGDDKYKSVMFHDMGICYFHSGWMGRAYEHFHHAITLEPRLVEPYFYLICALITMKRFEEASSWLKRLEAQKDRIRRAPSDEDEKVEREWIQRMRRKLSAA